MSVCLGAQKYTHMFARMGATNQIQVSNGEVIVFLLEQILFNK